MQRNMVRDTVLLTVIQMLLDGLALLLNVFLNAQLGAEAIGILTLTASLYRLASVTASVSLRQPVRIRGTRQA